ncbi:MAG: HAD family hydrolase [Cyanophyceae cyanobacterium]
MTLKAVLFNFSGVIINDQLIRQQLIDEILLQENLRPSASEDWQKYLGRSDRTCLQEILTSRGRVVSNAYLTQLMINRAKAYEQQLQQLDCLPLYSGVKDFLAHLKSAELKTGLVADALRTEIDFVLARAAVAAEFDVIVAGDELEPGKPDSHRYLLAIERLNRQNPVGIEPANCLTIENTYTGIAAAQQSGIAVVGVANTLPLHMLQRQADWVVDSLAELNLATVQDFFESKSDHQLE